MRNFLNNHIQQISNDDSLIITNFALIGDRSDAIRLEKIPWIIPLESYKLHLDLNYEMILNIFRNLFHRVKD